jgi:hypothetical protein
MTDSPAPLLLTGLLGGLIGAVATTLLSSTPIAPESTTTGTDTELRGEFAGLRKDLGLLITSLNARPLTLPTAQPVVASARKVVGEVDPGLAPALASLEDSIRKLVQDRSTSLASAQVEMTPLHWGTPPARNESACLQAWTALERDEETEFAKYFGLSARQIYNRFGPPSETYMKEGGIRWMYKDEADTYSLTFTLMDGMVVRVWS